MNFRIWAWKGDYLNMGAGAELGIYHGGPVHWKPGKDYVMTMTIKLENKEGEIFYRSSELTWWITGFDPNRKGISAELTATYTLDFSKNAELKGMYIALIDSDDYTRHINKWTQLGGHKLQLKF